MIWKSGVTVMILQLIQIVNERIRLLPKRLISKLRILHTQCLSQMSESEMNSFLIKALLEDIILPNFDYHKSFLMDYQLFFFFKDQIEMVFRKFLVEIYSLIS